MPTVEQCKPWLRNLIDTNIAELRERELTLRLTIEQPARDEAKERALVPHGKKGADLQRYERMHELSFHKALSAFEKGRAYQVKTGLLPGMLEPVEPEDLIEEEEAAVPETAVATEAPEAPISAEAAPVSPWASCAGRSRRRRTKPIDGGEMTEMVCIRWVTSTHGNVWTSDRSGRLSN